MKIKFLLFMFAVVGLIFVYQSFILAEETDPHHDEHADHAEREAHDEHEDEEAATGGVGPGNAVTAADEQVGIKLSVKAQKAIKLKTVVWDKKSLPPSALVYHQDKVSVYRLREDWFKLIPVTVTRNPAGSQIFLPEDLNQGDSVVIEGAALLRVAELDAFSTEVGHGH